MTPRSCATISVESAEGQSRASMIHPRQEHSICAVPSAKSVLATGACVSNQRKGSQTSELYLVDENKWVELPRLQRVRQRHASCAIGLTVYVFCGLERLWWTNELIEKLDLSKAVLSWCTVNLAQDTALTLRHSLGVAPLNEVEILILGGRDDEVWGDLDDLIIFNTATEKVRKLNQKNA